MKYTNNYKEKKKAKVFKDTMYGVYSKWGMYRAFQYKEDAQNFIDKFNSHNMDIVYYQVKGKFVYSFKK